MAVGDALKALKEGRFIVLFDSSEREGECDLVIHASKAAPEAVAFMRRNAGGLICLATNASTASSLSLPFFHELLASTPLSPLVPARMPYGDRPSFSILFSHRKTFTGVTDNDRSKTITEFAKLVEQGNGIRPSFLRSFRSPGHVPLLVGRSLSERRGHTELALRLCELAGLPPAAALCEMLGEGKALGKRQARAFAKANGLPFIEGKEVVE